METTPGSTPEATPPAASSSKPHRKIRWRHLLRALHRDVGYLSIGLTVVYALSGLAVNHIADWDPNFHAIDATHPLPRGVLLPGVPDAAQAAAVLKHLQITEPPQDVYRVDAQNLDLVLSNRTLHVDATRSVVKEEGQEPRFLLRVANWLHLNRGKKSWTYIADGYAAFLLILATSGLFMLGGKLGLVGRGGLLAGVGALVPILYVHFSGGP